MAEIKNLNHGGSGLHTTPFPMPSKDPISGGEFVVSELTCKASGIVLRGEFEVPRMARLDAEQTRFLETFLRCRGTITEVEREMGISYPTVRARLDALLDALGLVPVKESKAQRERNAEAKRAVLEQLEKGEITAEEAKKRLRGGTR
jgi:hypothetical protein